MNFKPHSRIGDSVPRSLFNLDPKFGLAQHTHWVGAAARMTYDLPVMLMQLSR